MNSDWQDTAIRQFFEQQRHREREEAPSFQRVIEGLPSRRGWGLRPVFSTAALLLLLTAGALVGSKYGWLRPHRVQSASLSEWRSPTDVLLHFGGEEMLTTLPSLGVVGASYDWTAGLKSAVGSQQ
ncbi:MAG: hypothetical protein ACE5JX_00855 [Acidobacteriota bacterium]